MVSFTDTTGQPRSDEDLQEAIDCVTTIVTKHPTVLPLFTVHAMDIRSFLLELQYIRGRLKEAKVDREAKEKAPPK